MASMALIIPLNSSTVGFFMVKPPKKATIRGRISIGGLLWVSWVNRVWATDWV